ncbi:AAA ATPase domain [Brachionus plicatilis]|uniref:AAA ATPase domain n=1 Tax=Brachionus plicatilis TaxID=10195 RepID=A0A3M7SUG4_BRAPC|nr:AAA ATPase domain [Brachionus plicatilis]
MTDFNIFDKDFINFCDNHDFKINNDQSAGNYDSFIVLTGKNGIGKSRLLKLIREYIVTIKNQNYPYMIVRRLDYGEHDDDYDPEKTDHPLVTENVLKCFGCDFDYWKILIGNLQNGNHSSTDSLEFSKIFFKYYLSKIKVETDIQNSKEDETVIQNINRLINNDEKNILRATEYEQKIYFDEFKKFYRRQILKKTCYGSLKQMLMLNMRYQFDIDKINETIDNNDYGLEFPYQIEKICKGFVEKSDINERIIFNDKKKKVKFKDLSPGERLILHLIVLIKDRENIKMENIDKQIKQVLLLDEPDSHCEANLVDKFIDLINAELVAYLNIQVIMTTHNYLTICKIEENNLYVIKNENDHLEIVKDVDKRTSFDILAKGLEEIFDLTNQSVEVRASCYKGISGACKNGSLNGTLLENMFKSLTDKYRPTMIKIFLGENVTENEIENEIDFISSYKELNECDLNKLNKKYSIIWPKNQTNKAWDFMIYQKNDTTTVNDTVNLFQITTDDSKKKQEDTIKKHQKHKIEEKLKLKQSTLFKYFYISPGVTIEMHKATNCIIQIDSLIYDLEFQNFRYFIDKLTGVSFLKTREFFDYLIGINCSCECSDEAKSPCNPESKTSCTCLRNNRKCTNECHKGQNVKCLNLTSNQENI